jgi:hypothetical protein
MNRSVVTLIGDNFVQFSGKIGARNLQKFGAKFGPADGEFSHVFHIPTGESYGPARYHVRRTDEAAISTDVPDQLSGTIRQDSFATKNCFDLA